MGEKEAAKRATQEGKRSTAPCQAACPAGIDVPRYIRLIRAGDFTGALAVIRERIPFPSVCGHACVHPCEAACARIQYDEAIAIRMLKKVAAEQGRGRTPAVKKLPATGRKVAVIGAGPCGLAAAWNLSLLGHNPVVFETREFAGGMLRYGIPAYRLPDEIVAQEIELIREQGVEIALNSPVSSPESLLRNGFAAVLVATGAWKPVQLNIPGEDNPRVIDGIGFLEQINSGRQVETGRRVIVVGGGNTAIDAARVSIRRGADATLLYRRTRAEMPADKEEVNEAGEEGVNFEYLSAPVRIEENHLVCIRMALGEPDGQGRPRPVPVSGSEYELAFDTLIMAVGQIAESAGSGLKTEAGGTIATDRNGIAAYGDGLFAAGDAVSGPSTIIEAIARGREVSMEIDRYLGGEGLIPDSLPEELTTVAPEPAPPGAQRLAVGMIPLRQRRTTFAAVEKSCRKKSAVTEASRCFSCDLRTFEVTVDTRLCKGCSYCAEACSLGVFKQADTFNPSGYKPFAAVAPERCIGCLRCVYACPDFAITVAEKEN